MFQTIGVSAPPLLTVRVLLVRRLVVPWQWMRALDSLIGAEKIALLWGHRRHLIIAMICELPFAADLSRCLSLVFRRRPFASASDSPLLAAAESPSSQSPALTALADSANTSPLIKPSNQRAAGAAGTAASASSAVLRRPGLALQSNLSPHAPQFISTATSPSQAGRGLQGAGAATLLQYCPGG